MNLHEQKSVQLFTKLLDVPAPSGWEQQMAKLIQSEIQQLGYSSEIDETGNLIVRLEARQPNAPLVCMAAHMDEIGILITDIEKDGALRVNPLGGLKPWTIGECPVQIAGSEKITGVLSMEKTHGSSTSKVAPEWASLRIITGLSREKLLENGIQPGSSAAVPVRAVRGPFLFGDPQNPLISAWSFDDRMGVVALLRLLKTLKEREIKPYHPTLIAFTVREETGGHGAKALADREHPEIFIAVDGCPVVPPHAPLKMNGHPGIWTSDAKTTQYDERLVQAFQKAAQKAGTQVQTAPYSSGYTDASVVYHAGKTQRIAAVGFVRENKHGYEIARVSVFDNLLKMLVTFVEFWED